jgi:hypothetical protein
MKNRRWILLTAAFLVGCARQYDVWRIADSPDGRARASVERYWHPIQGLHVLCRVEVVSWAGRQILYPHELNPSWYIRADGGFHFAEIAWSADSKVFAVLVIETLRYPRRRIWFAYDVDRGKVVDPSAMTEVMKRTIRRNYAEQLREMGDDPIAWADTHQGRHAFIAKHYKPGAELRTPGVDPGPRKPFCTGSDGRQR